MYLINVVPLTKIPMAVPQVLTYFNPDKITTGSLVNVPLGNRNISALVLASNLLSSQKINLKSANFSLKKISKIITNYPVLSDAQIRLAKWLSSYYYEPLGLVLKTMLPDIKYFKTDISITSFKQPQYIYLFSDQTYAIDFIKNKRKDNIAFLSSKKTRKQYFIEWEKAFNGNSNIILGTRNALFANCPNLKEILIYEEENSNYKSTDQAPRIDVRQAAIKLAEIAKVKLTFISSVPSIKSYNAFTKKQINLKILSHKFNAKTLIIDFKKERSDGYYSPLSRQLGKMVRQALDKKLQILLFVNRKGAGRAITCSDCGHISLCINCDLSLTYHQTKDNPTMLCHHCGFQAQPPSLCPNCNSFNMHIIGTGTQKIENEIKKWSPSAKILRLDKMATPSLKEQEKLLADFTSKKADILIATQMILNHPIPKVSLVAVLYADQLVYFPDLYTSENAYRTINKLSQLAKDNMVVQAYAKDNYAITSALKNDYQTLYDNEIATKKLLNWPPFCQLIKLTFKHKNQNHTKTTADLLQHRLIAIKNKNNITDKDLTILGPSAGFLPKIKNNYIFNIIIKSNLSLDKRNIILSNIPSNWKIDVDPESIL